MREIKFRAWNNDKNEWLDKEDCKYLTIHLDGSYEINLGWVTIFPHLTIEQYTGLKDKNGKEIYEGDIVRITRELTKTRSAVYIYQIRYDGSRAAFTCWKNNHFACMFFGSSEGECEIIGNIHENPELLEDK